MGARDDLGADPVGVEVDQRLLVDHDVAAPGLVLQLAGLGQEAGVGAQEPVVGAPLPLHQRVPDEESRATSGSTLP